MILTGGKITEEVARGAIIIDPFSENQVNPNSYNYRLGRKLKVFRSFDGHRSVFEEIEIPEEGYVLLPKQMYLGHTLEKIGSSSYAMSLIGRSSIGRLGLFVQISANLGHTTSAHQWTLELVAAKSIRVYPEMIIGQVSFWENYGDIEKYQGLHGRFSDPQESLARELFPAYDLDR